MTAYNDKYFEEMRRQPKGENLPPFLILYSPGKKLGSLLWQCSKRQQELMIIQSSLRWLAAAASSQSRKNKHLNTHQYCICDCLKNLTWVFGIY